MQSQSPDTLNTLNPTIQDGMHIAAIDMGSNSFHMVVAQIIHNEIRPLEKLGEKFSSGRAWMTTIVWMKPLNSGPSPAWSDFSSASPACHPTVSR